MYVHVGLHSYFENSLYKNLHVEKSIKYHIDKTGPYKKLRSCMVCQPWQWQWQWQCQCAAEHSPRVLSSDTIMGGPDRATRNMDPMVNPRATWADIGTWDYRWQEIDLNQDNGKELLRRHSHGNPAQWNQGPRPFPLVGNFPVGLAVMVKWVAQKNLRKIFCLTQRCHHCHCRDLLAVIFP